MRLTEHKRLSIIQTFSDFFDSADHLWLFGSRVNDEARGGDIDLYIETHISDRRLLFDKKLAFLSRLQLKIGEQKIDVVINVLSENRNLPIYQEARKTGILLI